MAKTGQKIIKIKDPVSQMRIFTQGVKKQKINQKLYQNFKINQPNHIQFHSQKPNNNSFLLMKIKNDGKIINGINMEEKLNNKLNKTQLGSEIDYKLKSVTHTPKQKFNTPQTTNQQIGWFYDQAKNVDSRFIHKRAGCPQTHYADTYYTMKHTSLFSNNKQK